MALLNLQKAKEMLGIAEADTSRDGRLEHLIPAVEAFAMIYCNGCFDRFKEAEAVKPTLVKMLKHNLEFKGVQAETIGDYSVAFGDGDFPESILRELRTFRRMQFP